jgi:predicted O-linked N-acetylglucosamine transferase (SPINDLY family)
MMHGDGEAKPAAASTAPVDQDLARAVELQLAGRLDGAADLYRAILAAQPRHAAANHCLGMLHVQSGRPAEALRFLFAALEANPQLAHYWLGYLEALLLAGQIESAGTALQVAREHGLAGEAVEDFARRLTQKAAIATPGAHPKPARADRRREERLLKDQERAIEGLLKKGRFAEGLDLAHTMTASFPEHGPGWKILGALQWAAGNVADGVGAMETAARLLPQDAETHTNLGVTLTKLERFAEAEKYLRKAVDIDPTFTAAHVHLGNWFQLQGRYAEAEESLRRAVAGGSDRDAGNDLRYSSLLFVLSHNPAFDPDALFAEHCRIGAILEGHQRRAWPRHRNGREPDRPLRVGWVSGDFCNHAVAHFIEPVLAELNGRATLQMHAYYNNPVEDEVTRRLRGYFAHWQAAAALSDIQLAKKISEDRIDVLIDLSGHTSLNRLRTFARKPAPVQASWIGYPGTTGLRAMDYYLADVHFLPPGRFDAQFTEKLALMPANVPFQPYASAPPVNPLPALACDVPTFGSFNRLGKINEGTIALWSQLLRTLPESRLLVGGLPRDGREQVLIDRFGGEGIARERLMLHYRDSMDAYLALHHHVDICLDTYPYCGGTTTIHALWMGVPTLTVAGRTPAARQGAAILGQLGLDDFVADSPADFVVKGSRWAGRLGDLAQVRAGLRSRWQQSPARRPQMVADSVERAIRRMWTRWCAGLAAEPFEI